MCGIFVINPGSTSDELSFYKDDQLVLHDVSRYSPDQLAPYEHQSVLSQLDFRFKLIVETIEKNQINLNDIDGIIGRGGLLHPIPSGTYLVDEKMLEDLRQGLMGDHPSNLGGILAVMLAQLVESSTEKSIPAFIADPVVVDEMWEWSRYSGMPENPRISIFHALNQKRVARNVAEKIGKPYQELILIVIHGGGGISVGLHYKGKVVDVNNALDGEGPFTPQRSGGVPAGRLARMCFSGKYKLDEIKLKIKGRGGLVSYVGTSDLVLLENYIKGQPVDLFQQKQIKPEITPQKAAKIVEAMSYQIVKEVGSLAAAAGVAPDGIVFSGGIAYCDLVVDFIREKLSWISEIFVIPGGDEMSALNDAARRVLSGAEKSKCYSDYI
ncbi:MAG: hypothetical protein APR63_06400 [Desulfuromonas sp. SDB]|nr:MAG: hypothetical protein APR63_06400 [Desulfuromonas sp. SDB]